MSPSPAVPETLVTKLEAGSAQDHSAVTQSLEQSLPTSAELISRVPGLDTRILQPVFTSTSASTVGAEAAESSEVTNQPVLIQAKDEAEDETVGASVLALTNSPVRGEGKMTKPIADTIPDAQTVAKRFHGPRRRDSHAYLWSANSQRRKGVVSQRPLSKALLHYTFEKFGIWIMLHLSCH